MNTQQAEMCERIHKVTGGNAGANYALYELYVTNPAQFEYVEQLLGESGGAMLSQTLAEAAIRVVVKQWGEQYV